MIISPVNINATVNNNVLNIVWTNPADITGLIYYELFFTDQFDPINKNKWLTLAILPSNINSFNWSILNSINSNNCKVSIRSIGTDGIRGNLVISNSFSIIINSLLSPIVLSPNANTTYRQAIPFVFDNTDLMKTYSQRANYQIYYSSENLNIDWTAVAENIPVSETMFNWDISKITPSNDYIFRIILQDENGNISNPVIISNISIYPMGYFIVDTVPPVGTISIQNNNIYTKNRDIVLKLNAFDEASGVKTFQIIQTEANGIVDATSSFLNYSNIQSWHLIGADGIKYLESSFQDYAGNTLASLTTNRFFRPFNFDVGFIPTCFIIDVNGDVWSAFSGITYPLFKNKNLITNLNGTVTAMVVFNNIVYFSTQDVNNYGYIYNIQNNIVNLVQSFLTTDSNILAMCVFNNNIYISMQNGNFYQFDGNIFTLVTNFTNQIKGLFTDNSLLYLYFDNTSDIQIFDGTNFSSVTITNGAVNI